MKRVLSFILLLFILFSSVACSSKEQSPGTVSESGKEGSKDTESKGSEVPESESTEDSQAGIPEEYRLKKNIASDWNAPLASSTENVNDFPLFGVGEMVNQQQLAARAPSLIMDLFTVEEVETYFDLYVKITQEILMNQGTVWYFLYKDSSKEGFWDGDVYICIKDYGDPQTAEYAMTATLSNLREIKVSERRAVMDDYTVNILVTDTMVLGVSMHFRPPEWGPLGPPDEKLLLDFTQRVYDRVTDKMD